MRKRRRMAAVVSRPLGQTVLNDAVLELVVATEVRRGKVRDGGGSKGWDLWVVYLQSDGDG